MQFTGVILLLVIGSHLVDSSLFGPQIIKGLGGDTPSTRGIFDDTCSKLFDLLAFPRKVVDVRVLILSPLRIRAKVEVTNPTTGYKDYFFVEGSVCQSGFDQYAADTVCRSVNQGFASFIPNRPPPSNPSAPNNKCFFQYEQDQLEIACTFLQSFSNCPANAINLSSCTQTKLFEHQCAGNMHVAVICS
ncbi:unnamed protein product [Rotaria sp. Silwood2]|nr:unnamed protein product [Rotaria sp. Silwood2]CAF3076039.1 unnamed protein product [Rotaria sp. Silwood2]CAF3367984.1 unnamed protein product [Rotaria sp. Silwood2]CAF4329175.1 unnamed protein product [Rotaria sp. Silwood2]CAF4378402.1 unnamed protein product [Rotaria sp. Silwood2]